MSIFRKTFTAIVAQSDQKTILAFFFHEGKIEVRIEKKRFTGLNNVREGDNVRLKVTRQNGEIVPKKVWLPAKTVRANPSQRRRYHNNSNSRLVATY